MIRAALSGMQAGEFCRAVYLPSRLGITKRGADEIERVARQYEEATQAPVGEFADDLVTAFLQSRVLAGDRPATINGKRAKVLALWRCAWRKGVIESLPRDVPRLREPYDPPKARSTEELEAILRQCRLLKGTLAGVSKSGFWRSLFAVAACTGERPGAIIRTRIEDVDLDRGWVRVRSGGVKTLLGRLYPLADWATEAVAEIYDGRRALVWPWPHCRRHLWTCARRIMEAAGVHPSHATKDLFYSLRRWNLSYLAAESVELARAQAGHCSNALTLRHYVDPKIAANRRALDALPTLRLGGEDRQLTLFAI